MSCAWRARPFNGRNVQQAVQPPSKKKVTLQKECHRIILHPGQLQGSNTLWAYAVLMKYKLADLVAIITMPFSSGI
jgi:hypothetical protein